MVLINKEKIISNAKPAILTKFQVKANDRRLSNAFVCLLIANRETIASEASG